MLLVATNSGTLIIALPDLERALGTSLLELVWVILAYMISSTVLVLTAGRLSDLFGRKTAFVGAFLDLRRRLARRRLRRRRHPADPLADPAGGRRRLHLRQRAGPGHRRLPARAARPGDGHEHDGRRDRARASARCSAAPWSRSPGSGSSGSTCRWPWPAPSGPALILRELSRRDTVRGLDLGGTAHLRRRPDRARLRDLPRRHLRLGRHAGDRQPRSPPRSCCRCSC